MEQKLAQDISRFFSIFEGRTQPLMNQISAPVRRELEEEFELLRQSIINRLKD